jgi:hypothetical protein
LNITPEKDLTRRRHHCRCFLRKETVVEIATITNEDVGSQQWQWWGQATAVETEAAVGAHNNQPTNGSNIAAEAAAAAAAAAAVAAATTAAVAAAVAMAAMAATAKAQTAAAA